MSNVMLNMKHFPPSVCSVCPSCILCEPCSHKHDPSHNLKRTRTPLSVPERGVTPEPRQAKINTCVRHIVVYFLGFFKSEILGNQSDSSFWFWDQL